MIRAPELLTRKPADFDFVAYASDAKTWIEKNQNKLGAFLITETDKKILVTGDVNCEFELVLPNTSSEMLIELGTIGAQRTSFGLVPTLEILFTLKKSHRFLKNSPHFWKTLIDYHTLKQAGVIVPDGLKEFLKLREKETYTYRHPSLNQTKQDFFNDDQISYVYDHDSIHEAVKLNDVPAYTLFKKDKEDVQCDRLKFDALHHNDKISSVVEEAMVLAIERSLVPHPDVLTERKAWILATSKVMSSISSGWWREFAYENALDVLKNYSAGFWEKFQKNVELGNVKSHDTRRI